MYLVIVQIAAMHHAVLDMIKRYFSFNRLRLFLMCTEILTDQSNLSKTSFSDNGMN